MRPETFKTKIVVCMVAVAFLFSPILVYGAAYNICRSEAGGYCVNLAQISETAQTSVPGLEFLRLPEGAGVGDILSALYVFGIGLVGISALIVLVFSGIMYMTAGDSQDRTGRAKKYMGNAIFGLVLALLSWLILFTINPDLVRKLELNLPQLAAPTSCPSGQVPCPSQNNRCVPPGQCVGGGYQ